MSELVPSFLITLESGRLVLRTFYGLLWTVHIGQEASTVSSELDGASKVYRHLRECLREYIALERELAEWKKQQEAAFLKAMMEPGGRG